jgi:hypothetical protein
LSWLWESKRSLLEMIGKKDLKKKLAQVRIEGMPPENAEHWKKIDKFITLIIEVRKIVTRWNSLRTEFCGPTVTLTTVAAIPELSSLCQKISNIRIIEQEFYPNYLNILESLFPDSFDLSDVQNNLEAFQHSIMVLKIHKKHTALKAAQKDKDQQIQRLSSFSGPLVQKIVNFLSDDIGTADIQNDQVIEKWSEFKANLEKLNALKPQFDAVTQVTDLIKKSGGTASLRTP